ncbi:hypothetical protein PPL_02745 [Heterostelium album PN500]|uniref:Uncharacterized protein n=1 Tax=Heterostelium pallidum (strain ATCC 26659 / Pp 5 / PN500) TaxID=670386 RepID=D3B2Y1_HETP5|nr:hypothetical protein PPL_02745 [Heterostelium album PN500]EFA83679.1 hypothetical protein PPL_02745 [Heterostelium album PN500]|eukprot:XP_020435796.1 hypothetical protein PPL_02745 [Heterostelium album PN500]
MTIFENRIYRIIVEYLWFDYENNKSYARSLSMINWYCHDVICSLNTSFQGSSQIIDELLKSHFRIKTDDNLNRCSLFSNLLELYCNVGELREVTRDGLKLIAPTIRSLKCAHSDIKLMIDLGMNSLESLECNVFVNKVSDYEDIKLLSPTLKHLKIGVGMDFHDAYQSVRYEDFVPITKYLVSDHFQHLTSLEIEDTNLDSGDYGYFLMLDSYSSMFFNGLLKFKSLERLALNISFKIQSFEPMEKMDAFQAKLLNYLTSQKSLKSLVLPLFESPKQNTSCLDYLFQESSIERLHIDWLAFHCLVTRTTLQHFTIGVEDQDIEMLALVRELDNRSFITNTFGGITKLLIKQQDLQQQYGFPADRVLTCKVQMIDNQIDEEFLKTLKNNRTLRRIYIEIICQNEGNIKPEFIHLKPIDDIIKSHPTIRNKHNWLL